MEVDRQRCGAFALSSTQQASWHCYRHFPGCRAAWNKGDNASSPVGFLPITLSGGRLGVGCLPAYLSTGANHAGGTCTCRIMDRWLIIEVRHRFHADIPRAAGVRWWERATTRGAYNGRGFVLIDAGQAPRVCDESMASVTRKAGDTQRAARSYGILLNRIGLRGPYK